MLNETELAKQLSVSPAARVTEDTINSRITNTTFNRVTPTVTIAIIQLDNGFQVTGESACVNEANYNQQIGETIAHRNAFGKLWCLFGFLLAETQFQSTQTQKAA